MSFSTNILISYTCIIANMVNPGLQEAPQRLSYVNLRKTAAVHPVRYL